MTRRITVVTILFATICVGGLPERSAKAQKTKAVAPTNLFLPPPRTLRLHLTRAKKAIAEKQYSDAVQELGT